MNLDTERSGGVTVACPAGRLDSNNAKEFETALLGLVAAGDGDILLDFSKLTYISSAGLRVVLMAAKRTRIAKRRLALCALNDHIKEVFTVSGFAKILDILPGRDDALAHLSEGGELSR